MLLRKITSFIVVLFLLSLISACDKDNTETYLQIHLTDNPYNATEVNIDLEEVRVNLSDNEEGWTGLTTHAGIYNLLDFQNGIDTLIAGGLIPTGKLKEIRFVLGNDNSIKIDNVLYPLTVPSGSASGLKIKLNKQLNATLDSLVIDFDAALSIHQNGTGDYILQPVLKIK
jgi:hypothetical protein